MKTYTERQSPAFYYEFWDLTKKCFDDNKVIKTEETEKVIKDILEQYTEIFLDMITAKHTSNQDTINKLLEKNITSIDCCLALNKHVTYDTLKALICNDHHVNRIITRHNNFKDDLLDIMYSSEDIFTQEMLIYMDEEKYLQKFIQDNGFKPGDSQYSLVMNDYDEYKLGIDFTYIPKEMFILLNLVSFEKEVAKQIINKEDTDSSDWDFPPVEDDSHTEE